MASIADIELQKRAAVAMLDQMIVAGIEMRNTATSDAEERQLDQAVHALMERRTQLFRVELSSPETQAALDVLASGLDGMNTARMKTATEFIGTIANLFDAADKAIGLAVGIHNCSSKPTHSYYDWQLKNLVKDQQGNYLCRIDGTIVS
jgi:hypothetical protein